MLLGAAIPLGDACLVYPLTVKEVIGMGLERYREELNLLVLTSYDLYDYYKKKGIKVEPDINVFKNIMDSCTNDEKFLLDFETAFSTFIREQVRVLPELGVILVGEDSDRRFITEDLFYTFQDIIRAQNHIKEVERPPENESAIARKFRLKREEVERAKKRKSEKEGTEDGATFHDLISSLCVYNIGINLQNVGDMTIYAFYEFLERAQEKDKYEFDMRQILAGANPKKVKPQFWIRNLKNK